ncbi:hypothetical protein D3C78_1182470 [compost metagenome]
MTRRWPTSASTATCCASVWSTARPVTCSATSTPTTFPRWPSPAGPRPPTRGRSLPPSCAKSMTCWPSVTRPGRRARASCSATSMTIRNAGRTPMRRCWWMAAFSTTSRSRPAWKPSTPTVPCARWIAVWCTSTPTRKAPVGCRERGSPVFSPPCAAPSATCHARIRCTTNWR